MELHRSVSRQENMSNAPNSTPSIPTLSTPLRRRRSANQPYNRRLLSSKSFEKHIRQRRRRSEGNFTASPPKALQELNELSSPLDEGEAGRAFGIVCIWWSCSSRRRINWRASFLHFSAKFESAKRFFIATSLCQPGSHKIPWSYEWNMATSEADMGLVTWVEQEPREVFRDSVQACTYWRKFALFILT